MPSRRLPTTLLLLAMLSACTRTSPGGTAKPTVKSSTAASASATPTPAASTASKAPLPTPGAGGLLMAPSGSSTLLQGSIGLDVGYAASSGLISDNGGGVLAVTASNGIVSDAGAGLATGDVAGILDHLGAGLVSKARLVSVEGGQLVSKARLISDGGGGLISDGGGGLMTEGNSGTLIANNGGGLISNHSAGYRLMGTPAGRAPVAGMLVGVWSLQANGYLPLGVDAKGQPVYAVYTDTQGNFTAHVPPEEQDNILVKASVPGTSDTRLAVDLVANPAATATLAVDDATTVLTQYLRRSILGRLEENEAVDPCKPPLRSTATRVDPFAIALSYFTEAFGSAAYQALPYLARERVLYRFADAAIARVKLDQVQIVNALQPGSTATGPAMATLRAQLAQIEQAAASKLAQSPTFFDQRPYIQVANLTRPTPLQIRRPSDLGELLVGEYLATKDDATMALSENVLLDLGLPVTMRLDMIAAGGSVFLALIVPLSADKDVMLATLQQAIADEAGAAPDPACAALPRPSAATAAVTTLAGSDATDTLDGPGATAGFNAPARLALDGQGHLFVADTKAQRIRRVDLDDPQHAVTTIAGTGKKAFADGVAGSAAFHDPVGLCYDATADVLYVADGGNQRIRAIAHPNAASPTVATFAGSGTQALADGAATAAAFNSPRDLTLAPDGALIVADTNNGALRRIDPTTHAVTTLAGGSNDGTLNGVGAAVQLREPDAVLFAPWGDLIVSDGHDGVLRWANLDGAVGMLAGSRQEGSTDGTAFTATLQGPMGMGLMPDRSLVFADANDGRICRMDPRFFVTTIAGTANATGYADGQGAAARFTSPQGIAVAADGTIYVADTGNHRIRALKLAQ